MDKLIPMPANGQSGKGLVRARARAVLIQTQTPTPKQKPTQVIPISPAKNRPSFRIFCSGTVRPADHVRRGLASGNADCAPAPLAATLKRGEGVHWAARSYG